MAGRKRENKDKWGTKIREFESEGDQGRKWVAKVEKRNRTLDVNDVGGESFEKLREFVFTLRRKGIKETGKY